MKSVRFVLLLAILSLWTIPTLKAQAGAAPPLPDWLAGDWRGIGDQTNTQTQWLTVVRHVQGENRPQISYPDLECQGHWEYRSKEQGKLILQEIITDNSGRCSNKDWVFVQPLGSDTLLVKYAHVWAPTDTIATAYLRRIVYP